MGMLTKAMTRMRDEIVSARRSRLAFRSELVRQTEERRSQVSALCTALARDRAGAHRAWYGRTPAECEVGGREKQRRAAEMTKAKARAEPQPPAPAALRPQTRETATPVVRPGGHLSPVHKPAFKGSKKH